MKLKAIISTAVALIACGVTAMMAPAADSQRGDWTLSKSDTPGAVRFSVIQSDHDGTFHSSSDWRTSEFQGLDLSQSGRHEANFKVSRDAGRFECEGFLDDGEGAGLFHFFANPQYPDQMAALGFSGVDPKKQMSMAIQDVTLEFAREMKNEHLEGLDLDKLIAFRIFGVNKQFIEELKSVGMNVRDSDKLVAFRIHGVTPEMIRWLHQQGYQPDEDKLIAMRIHGATPEWIGQLSKLGYTRLDLDEMIAFRIHGVSPEFIEKLKDLGYSHPDPEQLIAMRIHGVTPEYIAKMQSRGMKSLSTDQLVNLRIHGID
jgi:hypothetical protein